MSGNVREWTRSLWGKDNLKPDFKYPYDSTDGRENLDAPTNVLRVLRGGSYQLTRGYARCAYRNWDLPISRRDPIGFRVVVLPKNSDL